jgi:hypothetical protein
MNEEIKFRESAERVFGEMSVLMAEMTEDELERLKFKTQYAYELLGGNYFIHNIQLALINSHLAKRRKSKT